MSDICIGKPIIQILARDGAWQSENGMALIAADELFHADPYAEIERLRAALHRAYDYISAERTADRPKEAMLARIDAALEPKP